MSNSSVVAARIAHLVRFERSFAVVIAGLSIASLAWVLVGEGGVSARVAANQLFKVPALNYYLLFASLGIAALLALGIALRRGLNAPAYSLAAGLAAWSSFAIGFVTPPFIASYPRILQIAFDEGAFIQFLLFLVPWLGARFALHFPSELPDAGDRLRPRLRAIVDSFRYLVLMVAINVYGIVSPFDIYAVDIVVGMAGLLLVVAMLGIAIMFLVQQRRVADEAALRRLRWIMLGTWGALALLAPGLALLPAFNQPETMYVPFLLIGAGPVWLVGCLVVSVFFSDSIDPRLALRRATLYSTLAALMIGVFVAVEGFVQAYIVLNTGLPTTTAVVLAGSVAGVTFSPARRWTEKRVNTLVERLMPAEVMAAGRREAATIAFVDMSGYTSLSDTDERSAIVLAAGLHKVMAKAATGGGGRVVKKIGDALLLEFRSAAEALAAIRAGAADFARLSATLELPALPLHAGVHAGEVVRMPDGDIMGAAVNVAARLMSAAKQAQVLVSVDKADSAARSDATVEQVACKGISEPVACRRLSLAGAALA